MLLGPLLVVSCVLIAGTKAADTTFKNVVIRGYSMYTSKFNVSVKNSNSLKDNLPSKVFDKIEIAGQVPILYKDSIADVDTLDELILDHNGIQEIRPGAFRNIPLRKLVITNNNNLEQIKAGVFNHMPIASLDLSRNAINTISSAAFDDMTELLNVNLADNQLRIWDTKWFSNTPLLTRVSLQRNLIEQIPARAFHNFEGEKQFGSVSLTINIVLSHNQINTVHKNAFKGLKKINNLWLDGNAIESWDPDLLAGVVEVKNLRLDHNQLRCLAGDLGKIFVADTTHIDGNPWECGCLKNVEVWKLEHGKDVVMVYSKLHCDAERIEQKINSLNQRLRELAKNEEELNEIEDN